MDAKVEKLTPFLVDARAAAHLCGCGLSLWYELSASGRTPEPIKLNSKKLWLYDQLQLWVKSGCPSRDSAAWQEILKDNKT